MLSLMLLLVLVIPMVYYVIATNPRRGPQPRTPVSARIPGA